MDHRAVIAFSLLWGLLIIYAVLAALDFGAGFYRWLAYQRGTEQAREIAHGFLKPIWEVTNVFLVLLVVGMVGFFPITAHIFGTALLLPLSLAIVVLAIRGATIGFSHLLPRPSRLYEAAIGIGGLLSPALLVSFVAASESGAITLGAAGQVVVHEAQIWFSPLFLVLAFLSVAATTHLSALVLYRRAVRMRADAAIAYYRRGALHSGLVTAAMALLLLPAVRFTVPAHFSALLNAWPLLLLVAAGWALCVYAIIGDRWAHGTLIALVAEVCAISLAIATFGLTRLPWLLYGQVRLDEALTPPTMFIALMVTVALGMLVLLPSLALLYVVLLRPASPVAAIDGQQSPNHPTRERTLVAAGR